MSCRSVPCLATMRFMTACSFMGDERTRFGNQRADLDVCSVAERHFDGHLRSAVVGPGVGGSMQSVARIIAGLIDLYLSDFEHVDPDLTVGRRQQYRCGL